MGVTHYHSASRGGPVEIASLRYEHAQRAHAKLVRDDGDPKVIRALADHIASIEATFEESK